MYAVWRRIVGPMPLKPGDTAPDFTLPDQNGEPMSLSSLRGRTVLVYFYPKADTPGCTTQACGLRDIAGEIGDTAVIGISPDKPGKLRTFADKYDLRFTLLADESHAVAEAYDVWKQKSMYGRTYMGIERSAFLVAPDGTLRSLWYKIKPKDTPTNLLAALQG